MNGTVSKLKANYVFLKTPLGIVTVSGKTGVRNTKAGQEMSVWVQEHTWLSTCITMASHPPPAGFCRDPSRTTSADHNRLIMQTPEGEQSILLTQRPASLAALKQGSADHR